MRAWSEIFIGRLETEQLQKDYFLLGGIHHAGLYTDTLCNSGALEFVENVGRELGREIKMACESEWDSGGSGREREESGGENGEKNGGKNRGESGRRKWRGEWGEKWRVK